MNSYYEKILATGEVKCVDDEVPFEIPQGWEWCRLNDVATSITDFVASGSFASLRENVKYYNTKEYALLVRTKDLSCNFNKDLVYTDKHGYEFLSNSNLFGGELILPNIGASIGKVFIVPNLNMPMTLAPNSVMVRLNVECTKQWLYNVFSSPFGYDALWSISSSTAQGKFNKTDFRKVLIPFPPVKEQDRIGGKLTQLSSFLNYYTLCQERLNLLNEGIKEQLKKSILQEAIQGKLVPQIDSEGTAHELLEQIKEEKLKLVKEGKLKKSALNNSVIFRGDDNNYYEQKGKKCLDITNEIPLEIPNSWTWARMGQIGDWGAGSTPQRSNQDYYNGNILWLKTGELNNGIVYDTEEKITQSAFQDCSLRMNKKGDVLIAMYGATIGKLAIVGKELTTNQACCGCTPYVVYNWFLFYFLMASRDTFIKKGEGGAQPNISRVKLIEHLIPLPPLQEQKRIVQKIEQLMQLLK